MAIRNNGIETNDTFKKEPSTVINEGEFLQFNDDGNVEPLEPSNAVAGLAGESILAISTNFASNSRIVVDQPTLDTDRFLMVVGTGTATGAMEGKLFDVDASDASQIDVSTPGTQFTVTTFINTDLVEVKVNATATVNIS